MKMRAEMPSISDCAHSHNTYSGSDMYIGASTASPFVNTWTETTAGTGALGGMAGGGRGPDHYQRMYDALVRQQAQQVPQPSHPPPQTASSKGSQSAKSEKFMGRRLVQVFISDPDEKVPLADCLLYSGQQKMTDLTDQELFFEIDMKSILDAHNAKRAKILDKTVKERGAGYPEYLEPTRVSKLKMVVVNVATF